MQMTRLTYFGLAIYSLILFGMGAQLAPEQDHSRCWYEAMQNQMRSAAESEILYHNSEICWDDPQPVLVGDNPQPVLAPDAPPETETADFSGTSLYALGMWHLKYSEGLRLKPYRCAAGVRTIGWGHALRRGEDYKEITVQQANKLLADDFGRKLDDVAERYPHVKERHRRWALAMLAFNINGGVSGLKGTRLERYVMESNWGAAADQLLKWDKALNPATGKYRSLRGLRKKRQFEALLLRGDQNSLKKAFAKADYLRDGVIEKIRKQIQ